MPAVALLLVAVAAAPSMPASPTFASIHGGETLGTGAQVAVTAGYSTVSGAWAQSLGPEMDLAGVLQLDWVTTELLAGAFFRQRIVHAGGTSLAWRVCGGPWFDFGSSWAVAGNRGDGGIQLTPGLAASTRTGRVLLSVMFDAPVTFTFARAGGFMAGLRGGVAFETPLWGDLLVGGRAGAGAEWSWSGAPFAGNSPRTLLDVSALLTYRVL